MIKSGRDAGGSLLTEHVEADGDEGAGGRGAGAGATGTRIMVVRKRAGDLFVPGLEAVAG